MSSQSLPAGPGLVGQFDCIQLSLTSLSGVDRHLMLTADRFADLLDKKESVRFGSAVAQDSLIFDQLSSCGTATVDSRSLRPLPWLSTGDCRVGGAMCHLAPPTVAGSSPSTVSPRAAAMAQVEKLKAEFGLEVKSAFEMEFMIYEEDGIVPFNDSSLCFYGRIDSWAGREHVFFDICQSLIGAGLPLESLMTEMAAGQFEITFKPQRGVASPDSVVLAKEGLRKCLGKAGLLPTFLATPDKESHSNGFHFNHSLWRAGFESDEHDKVGGIEATNCSHSDRNHDLMKNALYDSRDPLLLSTTARHWLAGLIHHGPGLALVSSPTLNCCRRLQDPLCPKVANWGVENRGAFLRVRNAKGNVYLEDRLPSSASNPYLVLASILAAGMDGLRRKLECPPQGDLQAPPMPLTLEGAIASLDTDAVIKDALGEESALALLSLAHKSMESKNSLGDIMYSQR